MLLKKIRILIITLFELLNRVSLDAPLVVLVWQEIISIDLNINPTLNQKVVLLLAIWLAYSADRYLECFGQRSGLKLHSRHIFYLKNQKSFLMIWVIILLISVQLSMNSFSSFQIITGWSVVVLAIGNQTFSYFESSGTKKIFSKKNRTSLLLSLACIYLPFSLGILLECLSILIFLFFLFWLNCTQINLWENANDMKKCNLSDHFFSIQKKNYLIIFCLLIFHGVFLHLLSAGLTFVCLSSITVLAVHYCINRISLNFDYKRVVLDQCYWISPIIFVVINYAQ